MSQKLLPTFIYIGAPKCGSTWIYKAVHTHPEVYVPVAKEIYFFDRYYSKGLDWYASFFAKSGPKTKAIGELSTQYLYSHEAALRIARDLPAVKVFACIRNPLERFLSQYMHGRRNNLIKDSIENILILKKPPLILKFGKYYNYLVMYKELIGDEKFRVFLFDDLKQDPFGFASNIYKFIGVDPYFEYLDAEKKVLPASNFRIGWLAFLVKKAARLSRDVGFANLVGRIQESFIVNLLYKQISKGDKITLTDEQRKWLIDYYAEDVANIEKLLDRDLSHWLQ